MGQGEVLKTLENKSGLTEKEIARILDITVPSVWNCLRKLIKSGEVEKRETNLEMNGKQTNLKCYIFCIKLENKKNGKKV
jgi:predicted transcriptional regulator